MKTTERITWRKATEQEILNGSDEMIEVSRETIEVVEALNWKGLQQDLFYSPLLQKAMILANPNAYSTFLKVLYDGENNYASEIDFLQAFALIGVEFTEEEKSSLNKILSNNCFSIRV